MSFWHRLFRLPDPDARDPRATPGPSPDPVPTPPMYRAPGCWNMAAVEAALEALEQCNFWAAGRLCDALFADEYVASLVGLRIGTVTGLPTYFEQPSAPGQPIEVRGLAEDWQLVFPVEEQDQVLFQTLMMGFSLCYDARESYRDLPQWKAWPAYGCRYDVAREVWMVEDRLRGWIDVTPGDGRWALFRLRSSRPWLAGYIRAVAPMMVIRQSTLYNWANHAGVYATPSRIVTSPRHLAETEDVQRAVRALQKLMGDSTICLIEGMKVELLELKELTYQIYQQLRKSIDESLAILFVGQAGTVKAAGGWGSAHTERRVTQQILERDVKVLGPTTWRDILAPYDRWKRGTLDVLKVPRFVWDATPPADKDADARRQETLARARYTEAQELTLLQKLQAGEQEVDMEELIRQRGVIPLRRRRQPTVQPPAALPGGVAVTPPGAEPLKEAA